jgi:hypothetical protein
MDQFETHVIKKTNCQCPMSGGKKFKFNHHRLGIFREDARAAIKMPNLERGWAIIFVNFKVCGSNIITEI